MDGEGELGKSVLVTQPNDDDDDNGIYMCECAILCRAVNKLF